MPYEPRTATEILQELAGQVVAQSPLTDLSEGSVMLTLLGATAEGLEAIEFRLKEIRDSYDIDNAIGIDLDERVADFPSGGLERFGAGPASGSVLSVTRDLATTPPTYQLPAGSRFGRSDDRTIEYVTVTDETFGVGIPTINDVRVICLRAGTFGNAPAGTINLLVDVPDGITAVSQATAIAGGVDREDDAALRSRARAYLSSLARTVPPALKSLALSFVDSVGLRVRHAAVFEDLTQPCYSEVVVDDGSGFAGFIQPGLTSTGTIPVNGALFLNHQAPAVDAITQIRNVTTGVVHTYNDPASNPTWVSYPERGLIQLKDAQADFSPGDDWEIGGASAPYSVYTGFISELQAEIEGNAADPEQPGWRALGTRVRVVPPDPQTLAFTINVILPTGAVVDDVIASVQTAVETFLLELGPGETLYLSQLYTRIQQSVPALTAVTIHNPSADFAPSSPRKSLRAGAITVI
jgi:uncharacterized phage protein gp47/JayE